MRTHLMKKNFVSKAYHVSVVFRSLAMFCFLLFVCVYNLYAIGAQSLNSLITINQNNAELLHIMGDIEKQSNYLFVYNKDVDVHRSVSLHVVNKPLNTVLTDLFGNSDVRFAIESSYIVLSAAKNSERSQNTDQSDINVSGRVVDVFGEPIPGVTVQVEGTTVGAITDLNGNYKLAVPSENSVLVFSFIGYQSVKATVGSQRTINITLKEDTQALDEVVVIGYGTARKSDLTGSLSSVSSDSYEHQNVTRIDEALQGRAAGLQISNTVGAPGGDVRIRIRGANSVLGDNSPLFVIDGFVGADFNLLNPNDIKSIEVLKDASSTTIYGSRGANGVILVTTKSGSKDGKVSVSYQGSVSISNQIKKYEMLSAGDFATTVNEHDKAMGVENLKFTPEQIEEYYRTGGFDYNDAVFQTAISTQHQLSISGGTEKTQYRVSGNFLSMDGIVRESGFDRYTIRANVNTKVNKKLSFRFNANGTYASGKNNHGRTGAGNPVVQALAWAPTTNPYDGNGGYVISDPVGSIKTNPLAMIYDTENLRSRTFVNVIGGARYEIIPGLSADFQAAADLGFYNNKTWSGNYASNNSPSASKANNQAVTLQTTTQISYDKVFKDIHHINAVVALETQKYDWESLNGSASNLKFAELKYDNLAQAASNSVGSDYSMWALLSYLGRINYTLMDKYLFSVSVRRDGSSKFADGHKFSTFPTMAIAWNLGNEEFIKKLNIFDKLKLRASWGLTGSQAISPYATLATYNTSVYYAFTTGGRTNGIQMGNPGNTDLKWETTEQLDFGLELGFFNNRLNVELDYFQKHTRDLLLNKSVPYFLGGGSIVSNVGDIENKGVELNITAKIISTKDWGWESTFNFSSVRNEVTNLGDETRIFDNTDVIGLNGQPAFVYQVGKPLGSLWGLKYLGPWKKDQAEEAAKYGCKPGDARYEDLDGNYAIDGSDYQIIGCGMPKYSLGWNNTVTYKGFTLNAFFQGSFGADKLNFTRGLHLMGDRDARQATLAEIKERYIPGMNENAWLPAWSPTSKWETQSTLFLENANYLRLKNLSVSYDFKVKKFADFRISLSATNLFTITKYKGIDPESSNVGGGTTDVQQGIDYGAYPNSKTYTLGLNITF